MRYTFDELLEAQIKVRQDNLAAGMPESAANSEFVRNVKLGMHQTLYWRETAHAPVGETDVHTEHCCVLHGRKYGDADCPVELYRKRQSYVCECCYENGVRNI